MFPTPEFTFYHPPPPLSLVSERVRLDFVMRWLLLLTPLLQLTTCSPCLPQKGESFTLGSRATTKPRKGLHPIDPVPCRFVTMAKPKILRLCPSSKFSFFKSDFPCSHVGLRALDFSILGILDASRAWIKDCQRKQSGGVINDRKGVTHRGLSKAFANISFI